MPSFALRTALDLFIGQVIGQLRAARIPVMVPVKTWSELGEERLDRDAAERRRLEALPGCDPDRGDGGGRSAGGRYAGVRNRPVEELAADRAKGGNLLTGEPAG
jgi:hypothetical protein